MAGLDESVVIHVGADEHGQPVKLFRVSSATMSSYKGIWNVMKPQMKTGSKDVKFPKDDPDAFGIILHSLHGNMHSNPQSLTLDALSYLAVLANTYDLYHIICLVVPNWISQLPSRPDARLESQERVPIYLSWLTISWVFGLKPQFEANMRDLVNCVPVNAHLGTVLMPNVWTTVNFEHLPKGILLFITQQKVDRFAKLDALLAFNSQAVKKLRSEVSSHCVLRNWASEACKSIMLGSLIK